MSGINNHTTKENLPPLSTDPIIQDRCEIIREIGKGSFGKVFLAKHILTN